MKKIRADLIVFSLIAGGAGTLVKTMITAIPYFLHVTNNMGVIIAGKVIFNTDKFPQDAGHLLVGLLAHLGFGGILAIGLSLIYWIAGTDFYLTKGAFFGIAAWILIRSIFLSAGMPESPKPLNLPTTIVSLSSHLFYGMVTGYIIVKFNRFLGPTMKSS